MIIQYQRRKTNRVHIGNTPMGDTYPVRIQSMVNVPTLDTGAAVDQAIRMIKAGAEYIRFAAQGEREAANLGVIRQKLAEAGYDTPLIADIHFNPKAADTAARHVRKVRINPGNYIDKAKKFTQPEDDADTYDAGLQKIRARFIPFLNLCRKHNTAVRIGVNHGSLSDRIMNRYGDTPEGMVASCMEFLRICKEENFDNVVISIKSSNTIVMVKTVRLLVSTMHEEEMQYPLHLGVTEAGDDEEGRIKSAVGIGALLVDGIGDTIRVSLSEPPEAEIPVARKLLDYIVNRENHKPVDVPDSYRAFNFRRITNTIHRIGSSQLPVVISDRSCGDFAFDNTNLPDYIYMGKQQTLPVRKALQHPIPLLVDIDKWTRETDTYPYFTAADISLLTSTAASVKFLELTYPDLHDDVMEILCNDPLVVIVMASSHTDSIFEMRAFTTRLKEAGCNAPVILRRNYNETEKENLQIKAAVDFGTLLIDGIGNGTWLSNKGIDPHITDSCQFGILQAARARFTKTEFISCPGCGRTRYDLQTTVAKVKAATSHLKGLKIGIMGCIVNGPGEMADADYGYVGEARGKISLYKGKECIVKNIPEQNAVSRLIELIRENGDWKDA